ncbi:TlpA family protein disulfide reductase [Heyndrickxia coagulans]|uniref:Thiol-disulfide isomerase or thioredoxin n=1 Tax=Heyndrickxia coagulans DSM 1 = ATCC 7050 TaxID=1121088 RepID=A0A8B4BXN3_HEYCO|nr:TlpA disulfide reductase family protein [Heyndrickxia coagulans]AJH77690.1 redoxin family protein [Heyndrickxia coagulans DSM 1 = ATCC 7050]MCR2847583.1 TlpA family protein disulfide reductase [Heyndrickxia coagulans]MED4346397.1 TlpA disulfide reductase family protein [Heyndrickxia coagulans]MED4405254.1 TlpA disulfide reductase family protein [Heyndrickxia coagulans]MED4495213.1 TlpA disulfide reductase family protein [Heyndrickxia coagulans]
MAGCKIKKTKTTKERGFMAVAFLLSFLVTVWMNTHKPIDSVEKEESAPLPNFTAPPFSLEDLQNTQTFTLGADMKKPVIVNFWASWCPPCRSEAPELAAFYNKNKEKINLYAVNVTKSDRLKDVRDFSKKYGLTFPVLLDRDGTVSQRYWVTTIPTTFLISKDGVILDRHIGYISQYKLYQYLNHSGLGE